MDYELTLERFRKAQARDYVKKPVLGSHLVEISSSLLELKTDDPVEVFGWPDDMKLRSCISKAEHDAYLEELEMRKK